MTHDFKFGGVIFSFEEDRIRLEKELDDFKEKMKLVEEGEDIELIYYGEPISLKDAYRIIKQSIIPLFSYDLYIEYIDRPEYMSIEKTHLGINEIFTDEFEQEVQNKLKSIFDDKILIKSYSVFKSRINVKSEEIFIPIKVRLSLDEAESIMGFSKAPYYNMAYIESIPQFHEAFKNKALSLIRGEYQNMKELVSLVKYFANK